MEKRINENAKALAEQFCATRHAATTATCSSSSDSSEESSGSEVSREQAFVVYKFLNTPVEMLLAGMTQMQPQQLIQFYRKLAIQLHPDKNRHPQATDAFQVVQAAMESAKASMRATQGAF